MSDAGLQVKRTHKKYQSLYLVYLVCFVIDVLVTIFFIDFNLSSVNYSLKEGFYLRRFANPIDKIEIIKEQNLFTKLH